MPREQETAGRRLAPPPPPADHYITEGGFGSVRWIIVPLVGVLGFAIIAALFA